MFVTRNLLTAAKFSFVFSLIELTSVLGCGQLPQGQVNAVSFQASGFTLPVEIVYSEMPGVQTAFPSISRSKDGAIRVVRDLVMNAVNDVLQEQGRNALLPDAVISSILQQLNITVEYTPLNCPTATSNPMNNVPPMAMMPDGCFIINGLVSTLCTGQNCMLLNAVMNVGPIPAEQRMIKGNFRTSNVIMANWSRQMWQSVLNRVFQRIASGRLGKYFSTAVLTINN